MNRSPITGASVKRVLFSIETASLARYWKYIAGVDVRGLYANVERITLCEAEDGLWFFSPMIAGNHSFYNDLYGKLHFNRFLRAERHEFGLAAKHVQSGAEVLDVGCGYGEFARWLNNAVYAGIDLSFSEEDAEPLPSWAIIRRQSLADHLKEGRNYDVVSAFQVLEHVENPLGFLKQMREAVKPDGKVIVAVPLIPSPALEIPAFPINMPPHHLTFWTGPALRRLFEAAGLNVLHYEEVPASPADDFLFWARKFSWIRKSADFARLDRYAIASMLTGVAAAKMLSSRIPYKGKSRSPINQIMIGSPT